MLITIGETDLFDGRTVEELDGSQTGFTAGQLDLYDVTTLDGLPVSTLDGLQFEGGYSMAELDAMTVDEIEMLRNSNVLASPAPSISFQLGERGTASFDVLDEDDELSFDYGQEVSIVSLETGKVFGGLVEQLAMEKLTATGGTLHHISCIDYQALADRRIFVQAYESETGGNIVREILDILRDEDVEEGQIQAGVLLQNIIFDYVTCTAALDKVAELCGYTWFIDEYKRLYFLDRTTYAADWGIIDGSEIDEFSATLDVGNSEYRNVQYMQGGQALTALQSEEFLGDGVQRSFSLGYPLAKEPTVLVDDVEETVGIKGVESDKDWYWNSGDNVVTQDPEATPLSSSQTLHIDYYGSFQLMVKVTQQSEITRQKMSQGFGSGKIERMYNDSSLLTQDAAIDGAKAKLQRYATIGRKLKYTTRVPGLAVGTLQINTYSPLRLAASQMLITSMKIRYSDCTTYYEIEACEGPIDESWQQIFCGLAEEARRKALTASSESDSIQGIHTFTKTWLATEHPNPFLAVYPGCYPTDVDFPCLESEDKLSYCVLYSSGSEFFRKAVTVQTIEDAAIYSTCLILPSEANGMPISHVGLWGGDLATATAGTGIEMEKFAFVKTKNSLESLQIDFTDIKGF